MPCPYYLGFTCLTRFELGVDTFGDVTLDADGNPLPHYELLFEERLALFAALLSERPVTWTGKTRSPFRDQVSIRRSSRAG